VTEQVGGYANIVVSISFSATKEQAALVKSEVLRCIEAARASRG